MIWLFLLNLVFAKPTDWEQTIDKVSKGIVSIRISSNRYFDTESTSVGVATGFVVDAERGIILTNRHVVEPGPVTSYAVLLNNEEIPLKPMYRDPVHDFGFYSYDPAKVKHMELPALELCPDCAKVGMDIRLIGNDAGEKISILPATLARLDRNAPNYGRPRYNDFNTFYFQAAAGSSGGSSGSPVLDIEGRVVALNAGGKTRAASSFFLPLNRVQRAFQLLTSGEEISRGTLQTHLVHRPYDEATRLGLRAESETQLREAFPRRDGVLVVKHVNPKGPADGKLRSGDVLIRLNGQLISDFLSVEQVLDESVGKSIRLEVDRGGKAVQIEVVPQDLHSITPDSFVDGCGGTFHQLSYQTARHYNVPIEGIFVAFPGYCFSKSSIYRSTIIAKINGQSVSTVEDFWKLAQGFAHGEKIQVHHFSLGESYRMRRSVVTWDRKWFPLIKWQRNDVQGQWDKEKAADIAIKAQQEVVNTKHPRWPNRIERKLAPSLVTVDFTIPYRVEGVYGTEYRGTGVIVDVEKGLVMVDRDTVPVALGDVHIIFAGDARVPGEVVWLHPEHNVAIVKYDPATIGDTPVKQVKLIDKTPKVGQNIFLVGRNRNFEMVSKKSKINNHLDIVPRRPRVPLFQDSNLTVYEVDGAPPTVGGVLADKRGRVYALWASFVKVKGRNNDYKKYGLPSFVLQEALDHYKTDDVPVLGVFWQHLSIVEARKFGLTDEQAITLGKLDPRRRVLTVQRVSKKSKGYDKIQVGDILLEANGEPVVALRDVQTMVRSGDVTIKLLRNGKAVTVKLSPESRSGLGVRRVLFFGGGLFHDVPISVADYWAGDLTGAYLTWCARGAPCSRDSLSSTSRIVSVNDTEIKNLDDLALFLKNTNTEKPLRFSVLSLRGVPDTITLRRDDLYWPSWWIELTKKDGWRIRDL